MLEAITVKPLGPHHCFMRSGSVNAFHTRSRGASKVREITKSMFSVCAWVLMIVSPCSCGSGCFGLRLLDHHHPAHAEFVGDDAELRREERLNERLVHLAAVGQGIEQALAFRLGLG